MKWNWGQFVRSKVRWFPSRVVAGLAVLTVLTAEISAQWIPQPNAQLAAGFRLTRIYEVPTEQGSWVSLCVDPQGRLIASDQYGGLYRITVDPQQQTTTVEPIRVKIGRAQGLLCAFDSLYVMAHAGDRQPSGLYRVRDTNGDDQYDSVELLREIRGEGEHGPHAIALSPDGKSLYICAGNHTQLPEIARTRVPQVWNEDQLLPRFWDASGHAVGILAPGGWVIKSDPDATEFELVSIGFRNQYDIAFNESGELFTYDADMEWDVGLPWYRPTRICHVTSGSEFGWRSGSGKWPEYYPDNLPAAVDIGFGSPTGVCFGTGSHFPTKYQRALFAADWSYGILYAVHLEPKGASYTGQVETFCTAPGLAITDVVVRPQDGALYFAIGGRRSYSALYRIHYEPADQQALTVQATEAGPNEAAQIRRRLETMHLDMPGAHTPGVIDTAWPYLSHADRWIRFAARTAMEHVPIELWRERAWETADPQTTLEIALAVARCGGQDDAEPMVDRLVRINWDELSWSQRQHWLRAAGLVLLRLTLADNYSIREKICSYLDDRFPSGDTLLDRELCRLLVAAYSRSVVGKGIELMETAKTQEEQIHFAYCLSAADWGWNPELLERYYQWFLTAGRWRGGNSFVGFLTNVRAAAWERLAPDVREPLESIATLPIGRLDQAARQPERSVVKHYQMADFQNWGDRDLLDRDLANGERMFTVAQCYQCHRLLGVGGSVGPDITAAGRRWNVHDLLETIVVPSKEISDQYRATTFQLHDGRVVTGRIANLVGKAYLVQTDMLDPGNFTRFEMDEIEEMKGSTVSMMPTGLLDTLTEDDIRDLLAFMRQAAEQALGGDGQR